MAKQKITDSQITNNVRFSSYLNVAQNSANGSVLIALNAENFDAGNNFSTSTYLFTAPVAGDYQFNFSVASSGANGTQWQCYLQKNSSTSVMWGNNNGTINFAQSVGGGLLRLAANDTIGLILSSNSANAIQVNVATTYMTGFKVS